MGSLRLLDEAGFDGLDGNPHALDLPARELYADTLDVWAKAALRDLNDVSANAAALLSLTFADDATA